MCNTDIILSRTAIYITFEAMCNRLPSVLINMKAIVKQQLSSDSQIINHYPLSLSWSSSSGIENFGVDLTVKLIETRIRFKFCSCAQEK